MPYGLPWEDEGRVDVPSGSLAFASIGSGEPLVLLHMLGGWIANWRRVAIALAEKRRRVVALDLPGHGDSRSAEPSTWEYSLEDLVADVTAAVDGLGVSRASFVGNSLGGCAAIRIAVDVPDLVDRLVLMSVAMTKSRSMKDVKESEEKSAAWFDSHGCPIPRDAEIIGQISGTLDSAVLDEQNRSRRQAGKWVRFSERGVAMADLSGLLSRIEAPVLLMYGERDPLIAMFENDALASIPRSRSIHIPGAGRFPHMERPAVTAQAILEFLESRPRASHTPTP